MHKFLTELRTQRWDDHRFYHHSRINQSLHLVSALSFLASYAVVFKSQHTNEARIGVTRNGVYFLAPWNASPLGQKGILPSLDGTAYILALPTVSSALTSPLGTGTGEDPQGLS